MGARVKCINEIEDLTCPRIGEIDAREKGYRAKEFATRIWGCGVHYRRSTLIAAIRKCMKKRIAKTILHNEELTQVIVRDVAASLDVRPPSGVFDLSGVMRTSDGRYVPSGPVPNAKSIRNFRELLDTGKKELESMWCGPAAYSGGASADSGV